MYRVTIYAPVVVLCLVNYGILPVVCMVSSLLEGRKKTSSIQKAVLRKNYTLMIINILILPTLALKTPDAFLAQFKHLSDSIQMQKTYDWTIGYCHNGCQCYGATSFHVCDDQSFSPWEKTATDENMLPTFHECQRRPCEPGDVPGDARKSEGVGPGGEAARIPHGGSMAHPTWGCYNLTGDANDIQPSWDAAHDSPIINGCSRNSSNDFGEPGGPDYHHLWPVCQESKIYCHHVTVHCQGQCETNDYLKIIGNFVLAANASFLYCFVVSAALLGTGWQLLNAAFYVFCLLQVACSKKGNAESEIEFWDLATNTDKISTTSAPSLNDLLRLLSVLLLLPSSSSSSSDTAIVLSWRSERERVRVRDRLLLRSRARDLRDRDLLLRTLPAGVLCGAALLQLQALCRQVQLAVRLPGQLLGPRP